MRPIAGKVTKVAGVVLTALPLAVASIATSPAGATPAQPAGTWALTGSMHQLREGGGAGLGGLGVRLQDGRVLVAGGFAFSSGDPSTFFNASNYLSESEIYDPATGRWSVTDSMAQARYGAAIALLPSGKVLAAGGYQGFSNKKSSETETAEVFDPASGRWNQTHKMSDCRGGETTSVLSSGKVLVVGGTGCAGTALATAEIYDPARGQWQLAASMHEARWAHSATTLADGRILVAGGRSSPAGVNTETLLRSAEIYDPATNTWSEVAPMKDVRAFFGAGLLSDGRVIVAGGHCPGGAVSPVGGCTMSASELFDPASGTWSPAASMSFARAEGASMVLSGGSSFLMAGGGLQSTAEIYDTASGTWRTTGSMSQPRDDGEMITLTNGQVLIADGFQVTNGYANSPTEIYQP